MKKIYIIATILIASATIMGFIQYNKPFYTNLPTNAVGIGSVIDPDRFLIWTGNVPPALNVFVKPADSPNFVGDNNGVGDFEREDFFRWSQQMFYWILSPVPQDGTYGRCNGLVLNSQEFFDVSGGSYIRHHCSADSSPSPLKTSNNNIIDVGNSMSFDVKGTGNGKHNLPLFFEKDTEKVYDIAKTPKSKNGYQLVQDGEGNTIEVGTIKVNGNKVVFYDIKGTQIEKPNLILSKDLDPSTTIQQFTTSKGVVNVLKTPFTPIVILPSQGQANLGGNSNVLMARNNSLVYYNIMVNDVYAVFSQMVSSDPSLADSKFPTTLAELNAIKIYATAHNIPIIDTDNRVLAMELKTSWVETTNLPNSNKYVTITAQIPNYIQSSTGFWTKSGTRTAILALVGMHVVGSVLGHPEMIWSTFEHLNNTPNDLYNFDNGNGALGGVTNPTDANNSNQDFIFYAPPVVPNTNTLFNLPHIIATNFVNNINTSISGTNGFTISPSNTLRVQPFGWGGLVKGIGTNPPVNLPDILNVEVSNSQLVALNTDGKNRLIAGDLRRNYFQVGAMWSSKLRNNQQAGTVRLSNSTMETYTQSSANAPVVFSNGNGSINFSGAPEAGNGLNCFSCHEAGFDSPTPAAATINGINPIPNGLSHKFGYILVP